MAQAVARLLRFLRRPSRHRSHRSHLEAHPRPGLRRHVHRGGGGRPGLWVRQLCGPRKHLGNPAGVLPGGPVRAAVRSRPRHRQGTHRMAAQRHARRRLGTFVLGHAGGQRSRPQALQQFRAGGRFRPLRRQATLAMPSSMRIRVYQSTDEEAVVALWQECGLTRPWNDPRKDIARKLTEQPELFLVGTFEGPVISTAMVGFDGHRGWVYYLAVAPKYRGKSFGRMLMQEAERLLIERGCPKLNLQVRSSNPEAVEFYRRLGYTQDEVVSLGRRLIPDGAAQL